MRCSSLQTGMGLALLLAGACAAERRAAERPAAREPTAAERESHARMLTRLARLAEWAEREDPYLGQGPVPALEAELARVPAGTPRAAEVRFLLSQEYLRLGRTEEALALLAAAREVIAALPAAQQPEFASRLAYEQGVAALRLAENRNCVLRHGAESCLFPIREGGLHADREGSEQAIGFLREALAAAPEGSPAHLAARWLLNVAHMTLGTWPDALTPAERIEPEAVASKVPFPRFTEVAGPAGVASSNLSGGAAAEDFDGDGRLDLLVSDWDPRRSVRFFQNQGNGTFADASAAAGLTGIGGGHNLVQADLDDDGWMDAIVVRGTWLGAAGNHPKSLLRNLGGARFVDVTYLAGLAEPSYPTDSVVFADYDLDGDLDVYFGNEDDLRNEAPSQLFRNEGDGTFRDVAAAAGVENGRFCKGASFGDYDNDRYPDLYVSNLGLRNRLYHNQGDGTFKQVGKVATGPMDGANCWFWDYDNDGCLDLYVASYYQSLNYRLAPTVASVLGLPPGTEPAALYKGDGRGGFVDVAAEVGLGAVTLVMGGNFGDLDSDGYLDFYLGTGYPGFDGVVPNVMYLNERGQRFHDVSAAGGFGNLQKGHGVVFADLDQDGDQDVFEQVGGAYPGDAFRNALFANPGHGNHWLAVTLVGQSSVRSAVGARLVAEIREGEATRSVHRHVTTGGSFGCNPLTQHLGLGQATRVERLEVHWPRTGRTQELRDLPVDVHIEIVEDEPGYRTVPRAPSRLGG